MNTADAKRVLETALICSHQPIQPRELRVLFDDALGVDTIKTLLEELQLEWTQRGVELVQVASGWRFQSRPEMRPYLDRLHPEKPPKYTRAAMETLAIVAYHQPVTRAEIEDIRGVATAKGTLDVLLETGWVRLRGRRKAPGRPVTYGTTEAFLDQFGLQAINELPGLAELKGAGFFDGRLPADFNVPEPSDSAELQADEDPLEEDLFVALSEERLGAEEEHLAAEAGE